jgi:hypothetical protein
MAELEFEGLRVSLQGVAGSAQPQLSFKLVDGVPTLTAALTSFTGTLLLRPLAVAGAETAERTLDNIAPPTAALLSEGAAAPLKLPAAKQAAATEVQSATPAAKPAGKPTEVSATPDWAATPAAAPAPAPAAKVPTAAAAAPSLLPAGALVAPAPETALEASRDRRRRSSHNGAAAPATTRTSSESSVAAAPAIAALAAVPDAAMDGTLGGLILPAASEMEGEGGRTRELREGRAGTATSGRLSAWL